MSVLSKKETELLDALEPRAASEGVEIVTVQVVGAKKAPTIRVVHRHARGRELR